jgi:uncharacterized protein (DUF433 family)
MRPAIKANRIKDIYGGLDPRHVPVYGILETAGYLSIPVSTLRAWTVGQVQADRRPFRQVIEIADPERNLLSFTNVCEAHVCDALRRTHRIPLQGIRRVMDALRELYPKSKHPLVDHKLVTSGLEVFIDNVGDVVNLSTPGQSVIRECLDLYIKRVEYDQDDIASKLFPFTRPSASSDAPKVVVLDPTVMFGRPVIANTRIATAAVYDRWVAGESSVELADDYDRPLDEIEEALRCERYRQAA